MPVGDYILNNPDFYELIYGLIYGANLAFMALCLLFFIVNLIRHYTLTALIHGLCFITFSGFLMSMLFYNYHLSATPLFSESNLLIHIGKYGFAVGSMGALGVYTHVFNVYKLQPQYKKSVLFVYAILILGIIGLTYFDFSNIELLNTLNLLLISSVLILIIHHSTKYLNFIVYARVIRNITLFIALIIVPYSFIITNDNGITAGDLAILYLLLTVSLFLFYFFLAVYGYEQIKYFRKMYVVDKELLLQDLSKAVERDDFYMVYQPQLDLKKNQVCGLEALIRWKHPQRGLVPPNLFIPIAEKTGLINKISFWVIKTVIKQCKEFQSRGFDFRVSINLSAKNLNPNIVKYLVNQLRVHGVPPETLVIEITETSLMLNTAEVKYSLDLLTKTGCYISLDDYGTGFSSLSYLHNLDLEELKIDQSFIKDIDKNINSRIIVDSTLQMGKSLKLRVVAEGVETEEVIASLVDMDCDVIQGYVIARPMQVPNLYLWLEEQTDAKLFLKDYIR